MVYKTENIETRTKKLWFSFCVNHNLGDNNPSNKFSNYQKYLQQQKKLKKNSTRVNAPDSMVYKKAQKLKITSTTKIFF